MANPFDLPNEHKNVKLIEKKNGLILTYVLSCPKTFPNISFYSRNKAYYRLGMFIPYQDNMSACIQEAYILVKNKTMLNLALYKQELQNAKVRMIINKLF